MNNAAEISNWQLVVMGGWLMIPIALCSLLGIAYALELVLSLRRSKILPRTLSEDLRAAMQRQDVAGARALCEATPCALSSAVMAGLSEAQVADWDHVERAIEDAGAREITRFRRKVRPLRVISEICPLLGLLGTIQGMMGAFQSVSASGGQMGKTEMFAGDIFVALVTTAAGLVVAIPALFFFYSFSKKVDSIASELEDTLNELFALIRPRSPNAIALSKAERAEPQGTH